MVEDIKKRLQKLRDEEASKKYTVSKIPKDTFKVSKIPENTETTTFEQLLRKKVREVGIVEVFEGNDGTLKMHTTQIIDNWLFYSLCVLAFLFVLLLTKIIGLW